MQPTLSVACIIRSQLAIAGRAAIVLAGVSLVSACELFGDPIPVADTAAPMEDYANATVVAPEIVNALCEGRAREVVDFLSAEPLSSPADQMYLAVALEASGRELEALEIYDRLGALAIISPMVVRCGDNVTIGGEVSELARFRAERRRALIARKEALNAAAEAVEDYAKATKALTAKDLKTAEMIARESTPTTAPVATPVTAPVAAAPATEMRPASQPSLANTTPKNTAPATTTIADDTSIADLAGRQKAQPTVQKITPKPAGTTGPFDVIRPDSVSPSGLYLAHLTSYQDEGNIEPSIRALEERYPALLDSFSTWSVGENNTQIWRVGVRTINFSDAEALCEAIKKTGDYCRVLDTTS